MRTIALTLALAACLGMAGVAVAGDDGCGTPDSCGRCGCQAPCTKCCRVVCEMKKVEVTCWEVVCEDFCAPLPRCHDKCCQQCYTVPSCDGSCCEKCKCITPPKCGKVRCTKKLVKKTVTKEVPTYKCVVEYACGKCCGDCAAPEGPAASEAPVAPVPAVPQPKGT